MRMCRTDGRLSLRRRHGEPLPRVKSGQVRAEPCWFLVRMCEDEQGAAAKIVTCHVGSGGGKSLKWKVVPCGVKR